jgi:Molybdopterin oxidoreductase Fe4S4 domain.
MGVEVLTLTRRELLKTSLAAGGALSLLGLAGEAEAGTRGELKLEGARDYRTICPYCSVGCGIQLWVKDGEVVHVNGDPDHPINEGTLCPKGASILNLRLVAGKDNRYVPNPRRLTKVLYRAPGASNWEEKDWDWAIDRIARKVKEVRDATFETVDENGVTVNRTFALAHIGSAALDNEENYVIGKLMRALGVVRLEHHARL